jgi:hypothetical protein
MPLRAISIQVSDRVARVYEAASPHERRKLDALLTLRWLSPAPQRRSSQAAQTFWCSRPSTASRSLRHLPFWSDMAIRNEPKDLQKAVQIVQESNEAFEEKWDDWFRQR